MQEPGFTSSSTLCMRRSSLVDVGRLLLSLICLLSFTLGRLSSLIHYGTSAAAPVCPESLLLINLRNFS